MKTFINRSLLGTILVVGVHFVGVHTSAYGQMQTGGGTGFIGSATSLGGTQGFGQTGGGFGTTGLGGAAGGFGTAANTGVTSSPANGPFGGLGVSGAFGGRGITGVSTQDFSRLNAANGVVVPNTTGATTGQTQFGQAQTGGIGGLGGATTGFGGGGLGGGLGNIGIVGRTGGLGGIGGLGGLGGTAGRTNANNARAKIRTIVKTDIDVNLDSSATAAENVQARMGRIPIPQRIKTVQFAVENGQVVLRGEVSSESDKLFAERLVMLEPGVNSVRNELTVRNKAPERIQARPSR